MAHQEPIPGQAWYTMVQCTWYMQLPPMRHVPDDNSGQIYSQVPAGSSPGNFQFRPTPVMSPSSSLRAVGHF